MADSTKLWVGGGCCCVAFLGIVFGVFPFVFFTTEDTEQAVLYSRIFAEFEPSIVESGGFHTKPYAASVFVWPRVESNIEFSNLVCNSRDGILITLTLTFQYIPRSSEIIELTRTYGGRESWENVMKVEAESSVRKACGDFNATDYQDRRGLVASTMEAEVKEKVEAKFGATVTKLQLGSVQRPREFENAVRAKENARNEIGLAEFERDEAITEADTKIDVAEAEAIRIIDTAETTAEIVGSQASAESEAIEDRFAQLSSVYQDVQATNGLGTAGILVYINNEIFHDDVTIAVDTPVKLNFFGEVEDS